LNDVHKLNEEQLDGFIHIFKKLEGDIILRDIIDNIEFYGLNREVVDLVLEAICGVLARKNPENSLLN